MLLLIILLVLLFGGGGGYYGHQRWGTGRRFGYWRDGRTCCRVAVSVWWLASIRSAIVAGRPTGQFLCGPALKRLVAVETDRGN